MVLELVDVGVVVVPDEQDEQDDKCDGGSGGHGYSVLSLQCVAVCAVSYLRAALLSVFAGEAGDITKEKTAVTRSAAGHSGSWVMHTASR